MKILTLLFTYNTTLENWVKNGSIERELDIYKKLLTYFDKIYFITYGKDDLSHQDKLPKNIVVLPKKYFLPNFLYSLVIPFAYKKEIKKSSWIKTNQIRGSWVAVLIKLFIKKKIFIRTGYTESLSCINSNFLKRKLIWFIEYLAYKFSDIASVTSQHQMNYIKDKYAPHNLYILPNGINVTLFKPPKKDGSPRTSTHTKLLFIGRLHKEKNITNLIKALRALKNITITIIGMGPLKQNIIQLSKTYKINIRFIDKIPNSELPEIYNQADIYIQPSLYEGNPKTILEAMACGLPVIASDIDGINNIIKHKQNGYLCNTDIQSIRKAIIDLQNNSSLRISIGKSARKYIVKKYNLTTVLNKEIQLYKTHAL